MSTPLDLPGDWEVALIDIIYPHTWINLIKEYHMAVLTTFNEFEAYQKQNMPGDAKTAGLIIGINNVENFILQNNMVEPVQVEKYYVKQHYYNRAWSIRHQLTGKLYSK